MDLVGALLLGLIRDVLVQGAGNCIVYLIWGGRVIPDVWALDAKPEEIHKENGVFYQVHSQRHMYAGPVFGIGILFWAVVILSVVAYVKL